jgi:DNA-binding response OmpR family regulator
VTTTSPLRPSRRGHFNPGAEASRSAGGLRVLVIATEAGAAEDLAALVRRWGYQANVASDVASAERWAEADPPDVVLLDAGARKAAGWAVARRLRAHPAEKAPFLIALADHRREIDRQAAARVGVDLYLVKPADTDLLEGVLRRFARIITPTEALPVGEPGAPSPDTHLALT